MRVLWLCVFEGVGVGDRVWVDVEVLEDSGGRSLLIIKDIDVYAQSPTNPRSSTLNSEEPV